MPYRVIGTKRQKYSIVYPPVFTLGVSYPLI
jgi:hypothetical protein